LKKGGNSAKTPWRMLNDHFFGPDSIAVVGASSNISKPGGKLTYNLIEGRFQGELYLVNPKSDEIFGRSVFYTIDQIDSGVDLAFIVLPAAICLQEIKNLHSQCGTKAFVIISAGFSEVGGDGVQLEREIRQFAMENDCQIVGPNCTGLITQKFAGTFTTPIPEFENEGVTLLSASGATAVFLMEQGISLGLKFRQIVSVGNGMMVQLEDFLAHLDRVEMPDGAVVLLYVEAIKDPEKFYRHTHSLITKGCRIAALKSGISKKGSQAAASHTGALANADDAVDALFRKSGIIRCNSRNELITVGQVLNQKPMRGNRMAVLTHAGGPGVMATDHLELNGFQLPELEPNTQSDLLSQLLPGSSVKNPFDILATGTRKELSMVMKAINHSQQYDGVVVIFGSPGLFDEQEIFETLADFQTQMEIPVYVIGPSLINTRQELIHFRKLGKHFYSDESLLCDALGKVLSQTKIAHGDYQKFSDLKKKDHEFMSPEATFRLLENHGFEVAGFDLSSTFEEVEAFWSKHRASIVLKATDILHKTDQKAVFVGLQNKEELREAYDSLRSISKAPLLVQQQYTGYEIYLGINFDPLFGHQLFIGAGGIYLEARKDIVSGLLPLNEPEARWMIDQVRESTVWKGVRNQSGIDVDHLVEVMIMLSDLIEAHPEIKELDINPLMAQGDRMVVVDARIKR
jgi:acyl-CoA synthetase (NDP forming)